MQKNHIIFLFLFSLSVLTSQTKIIVDADTGNEVDDLFALTRILLEPSVEITALNAAQWQASHWAVEETMENSYRLNQQLLGELGISVATFRGGSARMYDWGDRAQHSAASYEIIRQAKQLKNNQKLPILVLGALTNIASALFIEPTISSNIEIYWLGSTIDFNTGVLKRNDFNCAMDQYALDYLLESDVEMNILPVSVAQLMKVDRQLMENEISNNPIGKFLMDRWYNHIDGGRKNRVLWDLALISAFIHPKMAKTKTVRTSKDSGNREITFYSEINATEIYQDYYDTLKILNKKK